MFGKIFSAAVIVAVFASVQALPAPMPFPAGRNNSVNANPGRNITYGNTTATAQRNGADNACARGFTQFCGLYTPTNGTLATNGSNTTNTTAPTNVTRRSVLLSDGDDSDSSFDVSTALGQDEADSSEGDDSTDEDEFPFLPLSSDASVDGEYSAEQTSSDEGDF